MKRFSEKGFYIRLTLVKGKAHSLSYFFSKPVIFCILIKIKSRKGLKWTQSKEYCFDVTREYLGAGRFFAEIDNASQGFVGSIRSLRD